MQQVVPLLFVIASCGAATPDLEQALEERISDADECITLEMVLNDLVAAEEQGQLSERVTVELAEFIAFRAQGLAEDMVASPAKDQCETLAFTLFDALLQPAEP